MLCRLYLLSLSKRRTFVVICVFLIIIFMMCILYADKKGIRIRRDSIDAYPHPIIVREKTIQQEYVDYSVHQFNLKPLDQQTIVLDYPQELGKVINDVLSFQYLLDVGFDLMNKTCLKWNMDEETFQQRAKRTLLIVVISAVGNFERRRILRESWASRDGVLVAANSVQVVFLVGLSSNQSATMNLKNESSFYRDIIQVNTIDAYSNLTLKSVALLHWTHTHCRKVDWVLKCDDDNYVNGELFLTLLKRLGTNSDFSIYGKVVPTLVPERKKSKIRHFILFFIILMQKLFLYRDYYRPKALHQPFCVALVIFILKFSSNLIFLS